MAYIIWNDSSHKTGKTYPGMDHTHTKGQRTCQICVQNQKDVIAAGIYRWVKSAAKILELNICTAMIKMFEPVRNKTK